MPWIISSKKQWKRPLLWLAFSGAAFLLLWRPQATANGISRGLSVCSSVIIPTLYPFMLLTGLLTDSPLCTRPGRALSAATWVLFGLPGGCGPAILLSLVGGYPSGALAIRRLRRQGQITDAQATRMTDFCVNGGPGFLVSTVGAGLLGSVEAGLLLFAAHAAASLLIGVLGAIGKRKTVTAVPAALISPKKGVAEMVADTCQALLSMCGFVLMACAALSLTEALGIPGLLQGWFGGSVKGWSAFFAAFAEVSSGCIALSAGSPLAPFWLSLCLGWGGLSVHGQLAGALTGMRVLSLRFFAMRLIHGTVSGIFALLLFRALDISLPTVQGGTPIPAPVSVSVSASVMLLLLCFLTMLSLSVKKTGKTENSMLY